MTTKGDTPDTSARALQIDARLRAKARAEIAEAGSHDASQALLPGRGDVLADVVLIKGEAGEADFEANAVLAGADGAAIGKALDALGLPSSRYALVSRGPGLAPDARMRRLRLLIEALDPRIILLLDRAAADDLAEAYGLDAIVTGTLVSVRGRRAVATEDFAASLDDERAKRRAWRDLQALKNATGAP